MSEEQIDTGAVEKEARSQGWVPKEEFRGPENAWVDAAEFVERGQKILPILQANNRRLMEEQRKEREKHQKELDELRQATEEFKKFQKEAYERKTRELDSEIAKIREQKKQAIADGDGDLVVELDDRLDDLKTQKQEAKTVNDTTPPKQDNQPQVDPALKNWLDNNSDWFGKNRRATALANAIAEDVKDNNPGLSGVAFLEKLDEALSDDEDMAKLLGKQKRQSPVGGGSAGQGRPASVKKSYDNLPEDAKRACDKFVAQKLMTREEYVSSYDWDN